MFSCGFLHKLIPVHMSAVNRAASHPSGHVQREEAVLAGQFLAIPRNHRIS